MIADAFNYILLCRHGPGALITYALMWNLKRLKEKSPPHAAVDFDSPGLNFLVQYHRKINMLNQIVVVLITIKHPVQINFNNEIWIL
jgi:hypothetical protein